MKAKVLKRIIPLLFVALFVAVLAISTTGMAANEGEDSNIFIGTAWALVPPAIAIVLAFLTKEVYTSLFLGIFVGALMYSKFNVMETIVTTVQLIADELGGNGGLIVFLVELGIIVAMMQVSGCTTVFANALSKRIKTRTGALLTTTVLGLLFFVDDYFNCLTTGNIMRPVTDKHRISRARLAYNIDCTAAPICIIAPISSWSAAVSSYIPEETGINGFDAFVQAIPFNYYALLTITMLFFLALLKFDFGPIRKYERMAIEDGDIYGGTGDLYADIDKPSENPNGKVIDMVLPVVVLVIACVVGLLYTGGFFEGASVVEAFSNTDSFMALPLGGFFALIFTILLYLPRKVITPKEFTGCIENGVHLMVPALLILTFSWALSTVCRSHLGATQFVEGFREFIVGGHLRTFLPVVLYLIGTVISFATGTSWGTFGILLPMVATIFGELNPFSVLCISATLAGSVTGDHCSPISETAIMSSTAAQVDFMQHVLTQLPYVGIVAGLAAVGYVIAGFMPNPYFVLPIIILLQFGLLYIIRMNQRKKDPKKA